MEMKHPAILRGYPHDFRAGNPPMVIDHELHDHLVAHAGDGNQPAFHRWLKVFRTFLFPDQVGSMCKHVQDHQVGILCSVIGFASLNMFVHPSRVNMFIFLESD